MNTHASIFIQSGTDHHDLSHHDHHKKSSGATITSVLRKQGGTACTGKAYQVRIIAGVIIIPKVHRYSSSLKFICNVPLLQGSGKSLYNSNIGQRRAWPESRGEYSSAEWKLWIKKRLSEQKSDEKLEI